MYGQENEKNGCILKAGQGFTGMRHEGIFWGDGNIPCHDWGLGLGGEHLLEPIK